jgi:hypothetical protein
MATKTYTIQEIVPANPGPGSVNTWIGVEARYGDGGDDLTNLPVGGFFSFQGDSVGVDIRGDSGLKVTETAYGDPGYHVHYVQDQGNEGFTLTITVEYEEIA